jgi:hypothetical protein
MSRFGSDKKSELVNAISPFTDSVSALQIVELAEKIIERLIRVSLKDETKRKEILISMDSHFLTMKKGFEKVQPTVPKKVLTAEAEKKRKDRKNFKPRETDYEIKEVPHKPIFVTSGFLTDDEKRVLGAFNQKLNQISNHVSEQNMPDGHARKNYILGLSTKLSQRVAQVNHLIRNRKGLVYSLVLHNKALNHSEKNEKGKSLITALDWTEAFSQLDLVPLPQKIYDCFGCVDPDKFDPASFFASVAAMPSEPNYYSTSGNEAEEHSADDFKMSA